MTAAPAIVIAPVRRAPVLFAATEKLTVPLPLPLAPDVIVIHGALLTAVHAQPTGALTLEVPLPPPAGNEWFIGETEQLPILKVAAVVVLTPQELVKTARYLFPFRFLLAMRDSVAPVAPGILLKLTPPLTLTCHCTAGVGEPLAAAVKMTTFPSHTV